MLKKFIKNRQKKKAINQFLTNLPLDLKNSYGLQDVYTLGQLESAINRGVYNKDYSKYALAIFLSDDVAKEKFGDINLVKDIRGEVAELFFDGNEEHLSIILKRRRWSSLQVSSSNVIDVGD